MSELIGVTAWYAGSIVGELKKAALMFDKIAIRHMHSEYECTRFSATPNGKETRETLRYIDSKGIVTDIPELDFDNNVSTWLSDNQDLIDAFKGIEGPAFISQLKNILNVLLEENSDDVDDIKAMKTFEANANPLGYLKKDLFVRLAALQMNATSDDLVTPIVGQFEISPLVENQELVSRSDQVIHMVYDKIPFPDYYTPWEAIFDFREDQEAKGKFRKLRKWLNDSLKSSLNIPELQEEMNEMIYEYSNHMNIHHKKIELSRFETTVVTPIEILESIIKLQPSKALKAIVKMKKEKIQLLEAELKAPGKEMALVIDSEVLAKERHKWWHFKRKNI